MKIDGYPKTLLVMSALGAAALLSFTGLYLRAVKRVHDDDPRRQQPVAATEYLAAPKHLETGAAISREEVLAHLDRVGYNRGNGAAAGIFEAGDAYIAVQPRQSDFNGLRIYWTGNRIARITNLQGEDVAEAELEPETLHFGNGDPVRIRRYPVSFEDLKGTAALDALLSSEDSGFYEHGGISLLHTVLGPLQHRGGSTLTQQLARACILHDTSVTLSRKVNEIFLAMSLEAQMPKPEIIASYCNCAYWGNAAGGLQLYGIGAGSQHLFGKRDLRALKISEAAALAALLNQPARYLREIRQGHAERLQNQRNRVLRLMERHFPARYSAAEIAKAQSEPLSLAPDHEEEQTDLERNSRYFLDYVAGSSASPRLERACIRPWMPICNARRSRRLRKVSCGSNPSTGVYRGCRRPWSCSRPRAICWRWSAAGTMAPPSSTAPFRQSARQGAR